MFSWQNSRRYMEIFFEPYDNLFKSKHIKYIQDFCYFPINSERYNNSPTLHFFISKRNLSKAILPL